MARAEHRRRMAQRDWTGLGLEVLAKGVCWRTPSRVQVSRDLDSFFFRFLFGERVC